MVIASCYLKSQSPIQHGKGLPDWEWSLKQKFGIRKVPCGKTSRQYRPKERPSRCVWLVLVIGRRSVAEIELLPRIAGTSRLLKQVRFQDKGSALRNSEVVVKNNLRSR